MSSEKTITLTLTDQEASFLADLAHIEACDWEHRASIEKDDLRRGDWRSEMELSATERVAKKARSVSDKIKREVSS